MPGKLSVPLVLLLAACALFAPSCWAQYFGQNKVQYHTFDFKVLHTTHFDIYYYPAEQNPALQVGRLAERWYTRLSTLLKWQLTSRQPVILYANSPDFRSTTVIPGYIGEATGGVTEPLRRRVVLPLSSSMAETDHVLGHELVHAFQYDISAKSSRSGGLGFSNINRLPLWFIEGMAEYLSLGPKDPNTAMWMRDAVRQEKLPTVKDLDNPKYFPYRWGQALWAYVGGRWGDDAAEKMLKAGMSSGSSDTAISNVLGLSPKELSKQWQEALRSEYAQVLDSTTAAKQQAALLIAQPKQENSLNVSPVVSPDGKYVMFFSSRGLFAIDVYMADAATGKVLRKITSTALNPHLDSLNFVSSAGAWSADSQLFAYGVISSGRPQLNIYDVVKDEDTQHIPLPTLGEILGLSWSPDGRQMVISGKSGGVTNLFLLNRYSQQLRPLTDDIFTELQPAWSPDGRRIAFVSDRFTSDVGGLSFGEYRLGLIDPATGNIEPVPAFDSGKAINPQWSQDGRSLFFISDRNGIDNLYRIPLGGGQPRQITNLQTGITGITGLSPAISVADKSGAALFSAYENGDYVIYRISPEKLAGTAPLANLADLQAALLPPRQRQKEEVASFLRRPGEGLVGTQAFRTAPYRPSLGLEYIAPPTVSAGMSNFGTMVGGGVGLYFTDMLSYHTLMVAAQTDSTGNGFGHFYNNLAGIVAYQNQRNRWNWGVAAGQVPFLSSFFLAGPGPTVGGVPTLSFTDVLFWEINRQLIGSLQYPFNRAQRVEFSGGFQRVDFSAFAVQRIFDPVGNLLASQGRDLPTPDALNLGTFSTALVYDTSVFGGTSPIMGQRYRIELGGYGGSLNFGSVLVDYRRYFQIAKPLILAGRVMQYGRYLGAADDERLGNIFVGDPSLVRGYDPGSFSSAECGPQAATTGTCPIFDQLIGSKIAVVNAEVRTPLLGALGIIPSRSLPPVENAVFYDAGVAWTGAQRAYFLGGPRHPVRSYGDSLRVNLLGFAVLQLSAVKPVDRPLKGWRFEFAILPGF